jgi:hypothetical protein
MNTLVIKVSPLWKLCTVKKIGGIHISHLVPLSPVIYITDVTVYRWQNESDTTSCRLIQHCFKQTILSARYVGPTAATKMLLVQLAPSAQSYSNCPHLDLSLFSYSDKWVSVMERPKACGEHPIRYTASAVNGFFKSNKYIRKAFFTVVCVFCRCWYMILLPYIGLPLQSSSLYKYQIFYLHLFKSAPHWQMFEIKIFLMRCALFDCLFVCFTLFLFYLGVRFFVSFRLYKA